MIMKDPSSFGDSFRSASLPALGPGMLNYLVIFGVFHRVLTAAISGA